MNVGFVGLGKMGSAMATRLLAAGHALTVYNRTPEKSEALRESGAQVADRVSEVCDADVVVTMVADDRALRDIALGSGGLLPNLRKGSVHLSMSTISVDLANELSEAHASAGQQFVSAPVFGRPEAAAAGKLFIIAAGAADTMKSIDPLLSAMGQLTLPISDLPRDASLVKIAGNFLIVSMTEALGEAAALVRKGGVPAQTFVDAMTSTIFNVPIYKNYGAVIAAEKFSPPGFAAPLGLKDIGLALQAAEALRVPMPLGDLLSDRLKRLVAQGGEQLDLTALAKLSAEDAGLR